MSTPFSIRTAPLSTRPTSLNAAEIEAVAGGDGPVVWNTDLTPLNAAEIEAVAGGDSPVVWIIEPIAGSTP